LFSILFRRFRAAAALSYLTACTTPSGLLVDSEARYGIGTFPFFETNLRVYHSALLDPAGIHLDVDGYVIGVERVDTQDKEPGARRVTHVIAYGETSAVTGPAGFSPPDPCIVFSLLTSQTAADLNVPEPMSRCKEAKEQDDYISSFNSSLQERLREARYSYAGSGRKELQ
jgi:hypothetical protein